jgi:hypothetical protein
MADESPEAQIYQAAKPRSQRVEENAFYLGVFAREL